ncbi:hypothetical protein IB279_35180 [Ensifer sp. ENS06]|uniref:hypothetical protein n=1 Tax=Ensifer sp. ENS06 TaxID=2769276 RepID=UPI00177D3D9D|nr:hypothetical protein [Ensifer sp. ENS06]MBD9628195.1 hypothetical protein [Ensifer sp. ENS06]
MAELGSRVPSTVAAVGFIEASPTSNNVIPGEVRFTADIRHPDDTALEMMEVALRATIVETATGLGIKVRRASAVDAVRFDPASIEGGRSVAKTHVRFDALLNYDQLQAGRVRAASLAPDLA